MEGSCWNCRGFGHIGAFYDFLPSLQTLISNPQTCAPCTRRVEVPRPGHRNGIPPLGLHPRSIRAALFSETGIMPIRYRRITLALLYAKYALSQQDSHFVQRTYRDAGVVPLGTTRCDKHTRHEHEVNTRCARVADYIRYLPMSVGSQVYPQPFCPNQFPQRVAPPGHSNSTGGIP